MGSETGLPVRAERSIAMVSRRLRCPSAAVACGVAIPLVKRLNHVMVSSRIGPQSIPSDRSPGG